MEKQKKRITRSVIVASIMVLVIVVGVAYAQTGKVVDHFDGAAQALSVDSGTPADSDAAGDTEATIIGGERDATLNYVSGSFGIDMFINSGGTLLAYAADPFTTGTASIVWDGNDNDATTLSHTGLGGEDLTDVMTKDGFHIRVEEADANFDLDIAVYESTVLCSEATISETDNIVAPGKSYFVPFSSFSTGSGCSGQASMANAGAVTMFIDGTAENGLDLVVEFIETNTRDFGDLPASYPFTTLADDGARHILGDIYLGTAVDGETDGQPSATAGASLDGDDNAGLDDEDGVTPTGNWSDGTGHVDVVVAGGIGCLTGFLDYWDGSTVGPDGDFADAGELIIDRQPVVIGTNSFTFGLPVGAADSAGFFARFRLVPDEDGDGQCTDQTAIGLRGQVYDGEVEDYLFTFTPTAVTLSDISARPQTSSALLYVAAGLLLLVGAGWAFRRVRIRR